MQPPVFYAPPDSIDGDSIELPPDEAKHALGVMRLKAGAAIVVVDGKGMGYKAEITKTKGKQSVMARTFATVRRFGEPSMQLTLAAGLSAGSKFDTVIEKGTELGVSRFVPLLCEKGKVKLDDVQKIARRASRFRKVALAAMKQCRRSCQPEVAEQVAVRDYLASLETDGPRLIFHPADGAGLSVLDNAMLPAEIVLMVGPESGFSDEEVAAAREANFQPISLGSRILRAETAGPVAVALVMDRFGQLS